MTDNFSLRTPASYFIMVCCCLLAGLPAMAQNRTAVKNEIHFTGANWAGALQSARQRHLLIFVDAYAAWCGPCKELKTQTFTDTKVAAYFNTHFISISMDMEKGEGVKFADQYEVSSYPTLLFIDGSGRIIKKSEGFLNAGELIAIAKTTSMK
jgi:thioredoxin 1